VRSGRRLAVDVGKVRVGLAISDFHGILASPLQNVARQTDDNETIRLISAATEDQDLLEIYVGLPVSMSGNATASTEDAVLLANLLALATDVPVRMIDERLTTVSASAALRSSGKNSKDGRKVIDQIAATMILEQALAIEKNTGREPGIELADIDV
jgi:putative Holliday junction resolvase